MSTPKPLCECSTKFILHLQDATRRRMDELMREMDVCLDSLQTYSAELHRREEQANANRQRIEQLGNRLKPLLLPLEGDA